MLRRYCRKPIASSVDAARLSRRKRFVGSGETVACWGMEVARRVCWQAEGHRRRRVERHYPVQGGNGPMRTVTKQRRGLWLVGMLLASVLGGVSVAAALEVGQQAPDFTLPSTTGEKISLSQFRGKQLVLLEFYGVDFEPV